MKKILLGILFALITPFVLIGGILTGFVFGIIALSFLTIDVGISFVEFLWEKIR